MDKRNKERFRISEFSERDVRYQDLWRCKTSLVDGRR